MKELNLIFRDSDGTETPMASLKRYLELKQRADKMMLAIVYWLSEEASEDDYLSRFKEALKEYREFSIK